ncbi:MAG TPA: hypothetical protein VE988_00945 [Gemmataceae bacterium]|nr:hypothetical protein [Gemmataceae bacterium]
MRKTQALLGIALLIGAAGCPPDGGRFNLIRPSGGGGGPGPTSTEVPTKDALVSYLNALSANNPGIQSDDISLTCYMDSAIGIPVGGKIRAQGPRNFRMSADNPITRDREVDLGSNDKEFWYWIRQSGDPQVFCSYQALEQGQVKKMPFPFQPDWVLEAMAMGNYGPAEKYELAVEKEQLKLIERTKSPQGLPVKKIIVFNRAKANTNPPSSCQPQITDFLLVEEANNKLICSAHITRRQIIGKTEIPREMELRWPEAKLKLILHLDHITLNTAQRPIQPQVYVRTQMKGIGSFDMATGRMEGVQQAGGPK